MVDKGYSNKNESSHAYESVGKEDRKSFDPPDEELDIEVPSSSQMGQVNVDVAVADELKGCISSRLTNNNDGNDEEKYIQEGTALVAEVTDSNQEKEDDSTYLSEDTYTLMTTIGVFSKGWFLSAATSISQFIIVLLVLLEQVAQGHGKTRAFGIPTSVSTSVRTGQIFAVVINAFQSSDVITSFRDLPELWYHKDGWKKLVNIVPSNYVNGGNALLHEWVKRILVPYVMRFVTGALVMVVSLIIIIQSESTIELFQNFAAMHLIAELDNLVFLLALHGYFGEGLKVNCNEAKQAHYKDSGNSKKTYFGVTMQQVLLIAIILLSLCVFIPVSVQQGTGSLFRNDYPNCDIATEDIGKIGDGRCDGGKFNTIGCGFDGGDCINFNIAYPGCTFESPWKINDDVCDAEANVPECNYDGGDCASAFAGNGVCNVQYNTTENNFDGGDCAYGSMGWFNYTRPNCILSSYEYDFVATYGYQCWAIESIAGEKAQSCC